MAKKIRIISKRVGEPFRSTYISNDLKNMQRYVGGYIEAAPLFPGVYAVCDEDGINKGKEYNITVCGVPIHGDFFICGIDGEEFADCPFAFQERMQMLCPEFRPPRKGIF